MTVLPTPEMVVFVDLRHGWSVIGRVIAALPAMQRVSDEDMLRYYHLEPTDIRHFHLSRPAKYPRVVVRRANGREVVLPLNPDVYVEIAK